MQSNKSLILYDEKGRIWAATQDFEESEPLIRYFTNTQRGEDALPEAIQEWRKEMSNDPFKVEKIGE